MKAILLKDWYIMRKNLGVMFLAILVIGISFIFFTGYDVSFLCIIFPVLICSLVSNSIGRDKLMKWDKYCMCFPLKKYSYGLSKYFMYFFMVFFSIAISIITVLLGRIARNEMRLENLKIYVSLGIAVSLISGAIIIPVSILCDESKVPVIQMLTYFFSSILFIGMTSFLNLLMDVNENMDILLIVYSSLAVFIYIVSCVLYKIKLVNKLIF